MNKFNLCKLNDSLKAGPRLRIICMMLSFSALIAAFLVKLQLRPELYDAGIYAFGLLAALPNFLYVFCAVMAIPVIEEGLISNGWPSATRLSTLAVAFTVGTFIYEIIQIWMPKRTFDLLDIGASVIGAVAAWQVYKRLWQALKAKQSS